MTKIKFGVQVPQEGLSYEEIKRWFLGLEKLGFHSAFTYDHLHPVFSNEEAPVLENWIVLSALAIETSKIRIGTLVNCNSYRHPSILAKMAASLDVISGGRLEFMIGAGWREIEHIGYGMPFPPPKIRIEKLKEAIQIIKLMWTEHRTYFKGKYYSLEGALNYPKPLQKPYPRIWVGGVGDKMLQVIAEVGEGTNFWHMTPKEYEKKLELLRSYCEKIGRDHNSIKKSWIGDLLIGANETEVEREFRKLKAKLSSNGILWVDSSTGSVKNLGRKEITMEELERRSLMGTPSQIIDRIEEYVTLGVEYFDILLTSEVFYQKDMNAVKLFAHKVITAFPQPG